MVLLRDRLAAVVVILVVPLLFNSRAFGREDISWWDQQRKGANCFNLTPREQWYDDAAAAGIRLVRLAPSKWKGEGRDFLLGNADEFKGIPSADLAMLKQSLDWAAARNIRVVIAPLSLPGSRWAQQNGDKVDDRLYRDFAYHQQAARFWKELATALRDHPAVAGYNLVNEPAPERALRLRDDSPAGLAKFHADHANTPADIDLLYRTIIAAIREVDPRTPIVLDASNYAAIDGLSSLQPVADPSVLYAVHFYEPWYFNTQRMNQGKLKYGTEMTIYGKTFILDKQWIAARFEKVAEWSARNHIAPNRIFIGEIGCGRQIPGAAEYLADVVQIVNAGRWHWAFYGYREDAWEGMDYELGTEKVPAKYWGLSGDEREAYTRTLRKSNPLWDIWASQFKQP